MSEAKCVSTLSFCPKQTKEYAKHMNNISRLNTTQQLVLDIFEHRNYAPKNNKETISSLAKIKTHKISKFVEGTLRATCYEYEKLMSVWCRLELMNEQKRSA